MPGVVDISPRPSETPPKAIPESIRLFPKVDWSIAMKTHSIYHAEKIHGAVCERIPLPTDSEKVSAHPERRTSGRLMTPVYARLARGRKNSPMNPLQNMTGIGKSADAFLSSPKMPSRM
jgi:hypothetical protein